MYGITSKKNSRLIVGSIAMAIVVLMLSSTLSSSVMAREGRGSISTDPATMTGPSTISQDGSDFTTQAALSGVSARQTNNIVGTQSYYDVVFTTSTTGTIKFIDITFPAGILIGVAPNLAEREGIGAGTAAKTSATQIRYTVTSAVSVPAGTQIRLEFFNLVNPTLPNTSYKVTVTTRNAGGTIIDGPTLSNSLNMKQIGTGQIADSSITSTKPAASFMKKVTVKDTPAGHSIGWDPNGIRLGFVIDEPAITDVDKALITIEVFVTGACEVTDHSLFPSPHFLVECSTAPAGGSQLHYVVENLPAIVVG